MIYFLDTRLPDSKPILIALTNIYGINKKTSLKICQKLGFCNNLKVKELTQNQINDILNVMHSLNLILNNELKKIRSAKFKNLIEIKSYRGLRRLKGLPVRGQRTHTNAKSSKKMKRF